MPRRPALRLRLLAAAVHRADWLALLATVLAGASQLYLLWQVGGLSPSLPELQLAYSAPRFWAILQAWGADGRALYAAHFLWDHLHTLLYAVWGALVVGASLFDGWPRRRRWALAGVMPLAAVADLLENAAHLALLGQGGADPAAAARTGLGQGLVAAASVASTLKWLLVLGFAALLVRRMAQRWGHLLELRVPPLVLALVCALAMGLLSRWVAGWRLTMPWPLPALPTVAGAVVAGAAVQANWRARTTLNPMNPAQARSLVTDSVYRFSRNPMYLGMVLVLLGWAAWLGHPLALALVPLAALYLQRFQIRPEERALDAHFGPAYRLYCGRVRRWL